MGYIYKITNTINQKIYIGLTSRNIKVRWQEHLREVKYDNQTPIYRAFNKYGIDNFTIEEIEQVDNSLLFEKEKYYIKQYNSLTHQNGYNVTPGGEGGRTNSKLTEDDVEQIIAILLDKNNLFSFNEIGKQFNISGSVIQSINAGNSWYNSSLDYPLRKYDVTGLTIHRQIYKNIIDDICHSTLSLKEIQLKYNLSENQISAINQGKFCYNGNNIYYQNIYTGTFPIRPYNLKNVNNDNIINIIYDILFTKNSISKIGIKYNIQNSTLQYIANGQRRKELTKDYLVPLRKNLDENQKIFQKLYPNYKVGD